MTASTRVLEYCVWQIDAWKNTLAMMESGAMFTGEVRDGRRVDTTRETIDQRRKDVERLEGLVEKMRAEPDERPDG